jgi:hypothetical protein
VRSVQHCHQASWNHEAKTDGHNLASHGSNLVGAEMMASRLAMADT